MSKSFGDILGSAVRRQLANKMARKMAKKETEVSIKEEDDSELFTKDGLLQLVNTDVCHPRRYEMYVSNGNLFVRKQGEEEDPLCFDQLKTAKVKKAEALILKHAPERMKELGYVVQTTKKRRGG